MPITQENRTASGVGEPAVTADAPQMPFTLQGRTALVTGSGRGIGRAIAKRLVAAGANVMLNDLDEDLLLEAKAHLGHADRIRHVTGDLTDPATPQAIVQAILDAFGAIDIIVNNAGYCWDSVIQKTRDEQFQAMLDIHLVTSFRILRAASGYIREAARKEAANHQRVMRKIVNITPSQGPTAISDEQATPQPKPASSALPGPWPRNGADTT
jgi:3-oxoacyl-[acyl-carrier protein] reductase